MKHIAAILILALGLAVNLAAQQSKNEEGQADKQSERLQRLNEYIDERQEKGKEPGGIVSPESETFLILERLKGLDEPTRGRVLASFREYMDYRISGYQHRRDVFKWQLYSSKIIFFVVIFLVLAGVYFSGVQFHHSLGRKFTRGTAKKDEMADNEAAEIMAIEKGEVTEVVASVKGVKVSSPVLGVIILVISLLFFYLYLMFVYPIQEAF